MALFDIFIGTLFCSWASGLSFESVYNFNNHSYYFSADTTSPYAYYYTASCKKGGHYPVDITDGTENDVIASVLRKDRVIGIYKEYGGSVFYVIHTGKKATYTNFDPNAYNNYYTRYARMQQINGKWDLAYSWYSAYIICENDKISSTGLNITENRKINLKYDDLLTYRGHSYYIYKAYRDYGTTTQICKNDHDGYAFIPNDGLENCAINTNNHGFVYLGISRINNQFMTVKGYEPSYLPWTYNFPTDEVCVSRSHINGEFRTQSCNTKKHIICETDSVIDGANDTSCNYTRQHYYFAQILQYNGYAFKIFDFETSKSDADSLCLRRGSVLFVPRDQNENCAIMENTEFTIGLNYGEKYVKKILTRGDDYNDNYTNWASGYPVSDSDKSCVYAYYDSGKWKNDICSNTTFVCREERKGQSSTAICTTNYYESPKNAYSFKINSKTYSLFGRLLSYHDSMRLCTYYGQSLLQTTDSYTIDQISENLINISFHIDYRILWNDTTITWLDGTPSGNLNWAPGEPKNNDFLISCLSVTPNKTLATNSCHNKYVTVCVGETSPTMTTTTSKTSSSASISTTTTTTSTTTAATTTTISTATSSPDKTFATTNLKIAASNKSNKVAIGVGTFFGILGVVLVSLGVYIFIKKRNLIPSSSFGLRSFGSFRSRSFES